MPEMFACFTKAGAGGKTRFSCSTDSMVDDMLLLLRGSCSSANTITRLTPCKEHGHRAPRPANEHHQENRPDPKHRRRTAIHLVLSPARLPAGARPRL